MVRSYNGGKSWRQLPGTYDDIHFVNLSRSRPSTVYVATARGPYRSNDRGDHWELINNGLERPYTLRISASPDDADLVLVTVSGNAGRQSPQFYRSTDGGRLWQLIEAVGSDEDMVVAVDWDAADTRWVYVGTESGRIYCSEDRGESWQPVPVTLPAIAVSALIAVPFLLAGVYDFVIGDFPHWASVTILLVGAALMILGLYMSLTGVVPSSPLVPGERQLVMRHPAQKPAYARIIFSIPFFLGALYMLGFTELPYVYPFIPFVIGM